MNIYQPTEYTKFLMNIHALQQAGFPFEKDDLTLEQWIDLYEIKNELQKMLNDEQQSKK